MIKVKSRGLLSLLSLITFAVLTGCSSTSQLNTSLETIGSDSSFLNTPADRIKAKREALGQIFNDPLTRDAMAAIKRTGITIQWTYPLLRKNASTNVYEKHCASYTERSCNTFIMIGKVNDITSYVVTMNIYRFYGKYISIAGKEYIVEIMLASVLQTHKVSSSRTIVSAADLNNKTAIWVDANISSNSLRTASANSSTVRLAASSPISGYSNLGSLLTVGGGHLAPVMCAAFTLTAQCGGGHGTPYVPPAPQPTPEPKCNENACDSERSAARSANWKMAGAIFQAAGEIVVADGACVGATVALPPAAPGTCLGAALFSAGAVANGVGSVMDANADKGAYKRCKEKHPCVSCLGKDGYLAGEKSSWQSTIGIG